jgi:DNA-binding HxlR family transcriptional regulator
MTPFGEFCAFDKAVQHLGDRWSLMLLREFAVHGSLGFNALADGLPRISRSVLARRLRKLEDLGLIERDLTSRPVTSGPYRLTPAGEQLIPTLLSLKGWAERWMPENPAMVERDPDVVMLWLAHRLDVGALPEREVVIAFDLRGELSTQVWLLLERGAPPSVCFEDPALALNRYVYVEAAIDALYQIARGLRDWAWAVSGGSVAIYGEPELVRALPAWFGSVRSDPRLLYGAPPQAFASASTAAKRVRVALQRPSPSSAASDE